jgi:drug/metabolite transporter (DMT)-like permease
MSATAVSPPARLRATLIGFIAVLLWSTLALATSFAAGLPPFQLTAMSFALAFAIAAASWAVRGRTALAALKQPWPVWALGIGGLFGYHFFYFTALGHAPVVEASLIAYLWPLLIVLLSALLPGERLTLWHVAGALAGLAGAGLLVTRGGGLALDPAFAFGYLAALACAFTWSGYSVLSRRFGAVPTDTVGGFCGATAVLALICHLLFEQWIPPSAGAWAAVAYLGLGPVGAAFYVWDHGVKRGDIRALGASAYAAPLISTLLLILFGRAEPSWRILLAAVLIVGGAALAAKDMLGRRGVS